MGFGVSASHMIFFIAAVVIAATMVGQLQTNVSKISGGIGERGSALHDELRTDIRIINDPADMPNDPLVLYVLNTGSSSIATTEMTAIVDGTAYTDLGLDVLDNADDSTVRRGEVVEVTVTGLNVGAGDHRAKVIVHNGVSDTLLFTV